MFPLTIPLTHLGQEHTFPAQVIKSGYTHQIQVDVHGSAILFEPDEEGTYRAIIAPSVLNPEKLDKILIQAIAEVIQSIT